MLFRPVLDHQAARQNHGSPVEPPFETFDLKAQPFVLQHRFPAVGEQPLHQPLGAVFVLDQADRFLVIRQDAERQHPIHGMDDSVVHVDQDMGVVETVLAGDAPVRLAGAVHTERNRSFIEQAWRHRPQRMREAFAAVRKANREVVRQRRHVFQRIVILAHEHEDHAGHFLHRIAGDAGGADQRIVRIGHDRAQLAVLQIEGEAVVPAGDRALVEASGLGRKPDAAMHALIFQRIDLAIDPAQDNRNAADLDALDLVFRQFLAEQGRIPVVDEAPGCVLVGLVGRLGLRVIEPLIADLVHAHRRAPANGCCVVHLAIPSR